ncbi:MAG: cytochrome c maturation protein CcmE [Actinomycetota bacterium]
MRKGRYVAAAAVCLVAVLWMVRLMAQNVVYLDPVSEAVAEREEKGDRRFRMGGTVVAGSIEARGNDVAFVVTEGGVTAAVTYDGAPPELFEECAPVVVEGRWSGTTFAADRLLIRHGNEYEPPRDGGSERAQECPAS